MSAAVLALIAVILCILFRILNVSSEPQKPVIICKDNSFLDTILKISPLFNEPYIPPRLWGFNGHVQTILHSLLGRLRCPWPIGERTFLYLHDNSTLTYDLYQPLGPSFDDLSVLLHWRLRPASNSSEFCACRNLSVGLPPATGSYRDCSGTFLKLKNEMCDPPATLTDDITIAVCPGIANTSESVYIRAFVHYAQCHGYRCAVLNHLGALSSVKLTSPRIFSYGHTDDFHTMLVDITKKYPQTKIVAIGFSLGGNLVTKYLGEQREHPKTLISGVSVCQGYNAIEATKWLLTWTNFRRLYFFVLTEAMKTIILRHRYMLLNEESRKKFQVSEKEISFAATLPELDDAFTRKIYQFKSVQEMYFWSSSINYLSNIKLPIVFVNAKDDPLVPEQLLEPVEKFCNSREKAAFILLQHGGHLGFHEGGLLTTNPVSWLDRALIALVGALVLTHSDSDEKLKKPAFNEM